jgi:hypothetical protein
MSNRFARIEFSLTKFDEPQFKAEGLDFVFEYIIAVNITRNLICY